MSLRRLLLVTATVLLAHADARAGDGAAVLAAQSPERGSSGWQGSLRRGEWTVPVPAYHPESSGGSSRARVPEQVAQLSDVPPPPLPSSPFDRAPATSPYTPPPPIAPYDRSLPSAGCDPCAPLAPSRAPFLADPSFADPCSPFAPQSYFFDNTYLFATGEAFRQSGADTRQAAHLGANLGTALINDTAGLGLQLGGSGGWAEGGGQTFVTGGLFYRGDSRAALAWNIGAVADWVRDQAFDVDVVQLRAKTSVTLDPQDEIGVWGATSIRDDRTNLGPTIDAMDQVNLFYRYLWPNGWDITGWVGWRSDPSSAALGLDAVMPIDDVWAFTAGGHYGWEGDSWSAYAGVQIYLGGRAVERCIGQYRHMPYLSVADNGSMTLFRER
jgi:hypothetical protein